MSARFPEFGENDLPPPGGSDHDYPKLGRRDAKQILEAILKLRARSRSDQEPLGSVASREVVVSGTRAAAARFEALLQDVLDGKLPEHLHSELDVVALTGSGRLHEAIVAWRHANVDNLALVAENVALAERYEDELRAEDLWDVCSDVRWIEDALLDDLRAELA